LKPFLVWMVAGSMTTSACAISGGTFPTPADDGDVARFQHAAADHSLRLNYLGAAPAPSSAPSSVDPDHPAPSAEAVAGPLERKYGTRMSRLLAVNDDGSLVFQNPAGAQVAIPPEALESVDVLHKGRGAVQGLVLGVLLGVLTGFIVETVSLGSGCDSAQRTCGTTTSAAIDGMLLSGLLFAIPGTIIGAIPGSPTRFEVARAADARAAERQNE
jgi:hypothetical protein